MLVFRALASGSSGNAYLLRTGKVSLLFEAGLPLPRLRTLLAVEDVTPEKVSAVLVSHEHRDHCIGASELASEYGTPIWANAEVLRAAGLHDLASAAILEVGKLALFGDVEVTSFPVVHDSVRPVGFLIRTAGRTISLATDLGHPTGEVEEAVSLSDLVVLEANHDTEMLERGHYPYHLKRRISGPTGHLSNSQAANALAKHVKGDGVEVWLAHLSRENNAPRLAATAVSRTLTAAGLAELQVGVALRDRPSLCWRGIARPRQLSLFPMDGA